MQKLLSILSLIGFMLAAPLGAQVIYKWVDADGQQHFSDVPREGAQEVYIAPPQSYAPTVISTSDQSATVTPGDADQDDPSGGYTDFAITSPSAEETIWNTGGTISVSLQLQPALTRGHTIRLLLDGRQKQQLGPGVSRIQLTGIDRGTHQLQAQVVTPDRQVVTSTESVTFYYKQTSANRNPAAAQSRPPAPSP